MWSCDSGNGRLTKGQAPDQCWPGLERGGGGGHDHSLVTLSPLGSSKELSRKDELACPAAVCFMFVESVCSNPRLVFS